MTDISKETDLLLQGAAPERFHEIKAEWGDEPDRVRLVSAERFDVQMLSAPSRCSPKTSTLSG